MFDGIAKLLWSLLGSVFSCIIFFPLLDASAQSIFVFFTDNIGTHGGVYSSENINFHMNGNECYIIQIWMSKIIVQVFVFGDKKLLNTICYAPHKCIKDVLFMLGAKR